MLKTCSFVQGTVKTRKAFANHRKVVIGQDNDKRKEWPTPDLEYFLISIASYHYGALHEPNTMGRPGSHWMSHNSVQLPWQERPHSNNVHKHGSGVKHQHGASLKASYCSVSQPTCLCIQSCLDAGFQTIFLQEQFSKRSAGGNSFTKN